MRTTAKLLIAIVVLCLLSCLYFTSHGQEAQVFGRTGSTLSALEATPPPAIAQAPCISKQSILDMINIAKPYPPIVYAMAHDRGSGQGGGIFAIAKGRTPDYINSFPTSGGDSVWVNIIDSVAGYNPIRCGAVRSPMIRLASYNYTAADITRLYGYAIDPSLLMDEIALQHCAMQQFKSKASVFVSAGNYYLEHRLDMPKVDKAYNGLNQYYWQGYGATLNFPQSDGMYRMPANVKESEDLEARNSMIIMGFTFNMNKGSAIRIGGGFLGRIQNCIFSGGDTVIWMAHNMSWNVSSCNFTGYSIGIYAGNLSEFIPDTAGGRIRGANSKGGSNDGTAQDNHFRPRKDGTSLAAIMFIGSDGCLALNTSQDGAPTIVKFIVYIDTKNLSVVKGNFVDIVHGEATIAASGAVVYASGGGAAWQTVSRLFIQTPTTGPMVWCNGGRNGSGINCSDFVYTVNRNFKSTGAVKWKINYCYGPSQPIRWLTTDGGTTPSGANLVQNYK